MKRLLEMLKGARRIEWILAAAAIAVLLLMSGGLRFGGEGIQTDLERRLTGILSQVDGVGKVRVMVAEDEDGSVEGVLVAAEGADDIRVCLRIQYAVQTLLGAEASQIEVVEHAK